MSDKLLYGSYPYPYQKQEHLNGYNVAPRHGPDNIELIMQGWQGKESTHAFGGRQGQPTSAPTYNPGYNGGQQPSPQYRQMAAPPPEFAMPSAGAPTNSKYGVYQYGDAPPSSRNRPAPVNEYQAMPAASAGQPMYQEYAAASPASAGGGGQYGQYSQSSPQQQQQQQQVAAGGYNRQHMPGDIPRQASGIFRDSGMHDHISENFKGGPQAAGAPVGRGPGGVMAVAHNRDSLSAFMGGMAGGPAPKDRENSFDDYYGKAHAGKATISHLSPMGNGLQGPMEPLDAMPHYRSHHAGHQSNLESNPDGGYIPTREAKGPGNTNSGLRIFTGQPQAMDHMQMSPTGLTANVNISPTGPRMNMIAAARNSSMGMSEMGLSHQGAESGYPAINHGPYAAKHTFSQLSHKEGGIIEGGQEPTRRNPHAGKNQYSTLTAGEAGLGGAPSTRNFINPHAGKGQASQITNSSGTMTIVPQVGGPELRKPAPGDGRWSTTYDDTYATVQASNHYKAVQDIRPHRF